MLKAQGSGLSLICTICLQVCADSKLDQWQLDLVDWGYHTEEERTRASQNERINIITHGQFATLLESGSGH